MKINYPAALLFTFASVGLLMAGPDPRGILELEGYGNSDSAGITSKRGRNDFTIKETLASGDNLFFIKGYGYNGTGFGTNAAASIELQTSQAWTSTANGTKMLFKTTPNGSVTPATAMTIDQDGSVSFAGAATTTGLTTVSSITVTNQQLWGATTALSTFTPTALTLDDGLTLTANGPAVFNGDATIGGTTPALTVGDAGEEDAQINFDGNALDFSVGLDDSADALVISTGTSMGDGTSGAISINSSAQVSFPNNVTLGNAITDVITVSGLLTLPSNAAPRTNVTPTAIGQLIINTGATPDEVCVSSGTTITTWTRIHDFATACSN